MDLASAQSWLNRYVDAWLSYDPDDVAALFSEDVTYRYHPYDEPMSAGKPLLPVARRGCIR